MHDDGFGTGGFGADVSGIGSGGVAGRDCNNPCRNGSELSAVAGYQMTTDINQNVNAGHLKRNAYLYVRQSTPRQVLEHQESGKRQYALRQRAIALGWPLEQIHVIDSDQGQSGSSAADREGFQKLVTEVSLGRAGIVLGLECPAWRGTIRTGTDCSRSALSRIL